MSTATFTVAGDDGETGLNLNEIFRGIQAACSDIRYLAQREQEREDKEKSRKKKRAKKKAKR